MCNRGCSQDLSRQEFSRIPRNSWDFSKTILSFKSEVNTKTVQENIFKTRILIFLETKIKSNQTLVYSYLFSNLKVFAQRLPKISIFWDFIHFLRSKYEFLYFRIHKKDSNIFFYGMSRIKTKTRKRLARQERTLIKGQESSQDKLQIFNSRQVKTSKLVLGHALAENQYNPNNSSYLHFWVMCM